MNRLDLFLLALLVLAGITGWRRGAMHRVLTWTGLVAGVLVGALVAPILVEQGPGVFSQAVVAFGALVVGGALGAVAGKVAGRLLRSGAKGTAVGTLDSALGTALSVLVVAFLAWFLAFNLSNGPFPGVADEIHGSWVLRQLDTALPEPPDVLAQARELFSNFTFPQVFSGLPPPPAGPVLTPSDADAAAAFDAARDSTVRVVGRACDRIQEGSGFVADEGLVLTNAHVVAGVQHPAVQVQGATDLPATVVLFDPALDVAVLRVASDPGTPLTFADAEVPRGTGGGVLGYPKGGDLAGAPAAVTQVLDARGRDIYGKHRVLRRVYELQTVVEGGNSGGPFVLSDGTVAGMIFAASTTADDLAYAITSAQLADALQRAGEGTAPVPSGACTR